MLPLRDAIAALPFVETTDRGIDYWAVCPTGDPTTDARRGRHFAAGLLAVMREYQIPGLVAHVMAAWRDCPGTDAVMDGFCLEFGEAIKNAQIDDLAARAGARHVEQALRQLPLTPGHAWEAKLTGDTGQASATGRHYGALLALVVHRTRDPHLIARFCRAARATGLSQADAEADEALWLGMAHVLGEAAMRGPSTCTACQRAQYEFRLDYKERAA